LFDSWTQRAAIGAECLNDDAALWLHRELRDPEREGNRLRIVLVDSSEVFRMGMKALLSEARDIVVAAEAGDAASALAAARAHTPDLVVTDLELPDESGVTLASGLREAGARVLLLAQVANEVSVRQAAAAGVGGYVLKSQPPGEIVAAIREAAAGRPVEPPATREVSRTSDGEVPRAARAAVLERLSAREREIFDLIIWGQTNKQVAVKLGISVKTVETHRSHINGKLQVHSAAELVRLASLCGVLSPPEPGAPEATSTARAAREKPAGKVATERPELPRLVAKIG
jgi:DNA-binding NarL/FixJ family response regulator